MIDTYELSVDVDLPDQGKCLAIGFEFGYKWANDFYDSKDAMMKNVARKLAKKTDVETE